MSGTDVKMYNIRPKNKPLSCGARRKQDKGFTLLEILIVSLIMGIFAMLGWPVLNGAMGASRLSAAAEEVVNALEYAQLRAASGQTTQVIIWAAQDQISVEQFKAGVNFFGGQSQLAEADVEGGSYGLMENPMNKGTDYQIMLAGDSRFSGVDITVSSFNPGAGVTFDSMGAPSKGGTVTLAMGGRQMVVTLNALTGSVSVSG
jgi:prepilin-type N-terminal cleavage/methylation domain-containing protein